MSVQLLFLSYSQPSKEIGTLLWSGIFGGLKGVDGTMMSLLNTVEVTVLENKMMTAIGFLHVLGLALLISGWI